MGIAHGDCIEGTARGLGKDLKNTAPLTPSTLFLALIAPARKQSALLDGSFGLVDGVCPLFSPPWSSWVELLPSRNPPGEQTID